MAAPVDILFIEDTETDAFLTIRNLHKLAPGIEVLHFEQLREAFSWLQAQTTLQGRPCKLVLMDSMIGQADGAKSVAKIRALIGQTLPIIIFSSAISEHNTRHFLDAGATEIFRKPVNMSQFRETLQHILDHWLDK